MSKIALFFVKLLVFFTLISVLFISSNFIVEVFAADGVHKQINFQGKLVNPSTGVNVADNSYSVTFTLYDDPSAGTNLWDETQNVATVDGVFRVSLGAVDTTLGNVNFNSDSLYLGVKVGADLEMTPRIRFTAVPYAFNATKVNGLTVTNTSDNPFSSATTLKLTDGKTVIFNDSSGANSLTVTTTASTSVTLPTSGVLFSDTNSVNFADAATGTAYTIAGSDATTGTNAGGDLTLRAGNGSTSGTGGALTLAGGTSSGTDGAINLQTDGTTRWTVTNTGVLQSTGAQTIQTSTGNLTLSTSAGNGSILLTPNGSGDITTTLGEGGQFAINATPTSTSSQDAFLLTLTAGQTSATGTFQGLVISQADNGTTGVYDSLAKIENLKTPETTTNGLFIEQNAASGTLTNALHITNTAGTLTTAILIDGTAPATFILDTGSLDISGAGAISGATGLAVLGATTINNSGSGATTIGNASSTTTLNVGSDAEGDILYRSSGGGLTRLARGSATQVIIGGANVPAYLGAPGAGSLCLKSDSGNTALEWSSCGGGSQTPWSSDINASDNSLYGLDNLRFNEVTDAWSGSNVGLYRDNSGDLNLNVLTAKSFNVQVDGTDEYNFSSTAINLNSNNITSAGTIGSGAITTTGSLTFSGVTTDIITGTNEDLTIAPNGTGDIIFTQGELSQFAINATPTSTTSQDAFLLTLTAGQTGGTGTFQGLVISQADNGTTGFYDSLAKIENLKTPETTTNGLFIEQNAASGTLSNALNITNTAGTLTTGISMTGTFTNYIDTPNFDVSNAGDITAASLAVGANAASSGYIRIPNNQFISARNNANNGDVTMIRINSSNQVELGTALAMGNQSITTINTLSGVTDQALKINSTGTGALQFNNNNGATGAFEWYGGGGSSVFTISTAGLVTASGGVTLAANQALTLNSGTGGIVVTNAVTNASKNVVDLNSSYTGGASNGLTYNVVNIANFTAANSAGADTVNGVSIGNLTESDPANLTSSGLKIGTGWDTDINLTDSSAVLGMASGATLTIGTSAADVLTVDLTNNFLRFGDTSNGFTFDIDGNAGPVYVGTARPTIKRTLSPEFEGGVLTGDGTNNTGTMISDFCSEDRALKSASTPTGTSPCDSDVNHEEHNYYSWTSTGANDYDIWVKWQVPSNFDAFIASNPITFSSWKTASGDAVTLTVYKADGTVCGTATALGSSGQWTSTNYTNGACTLTADEYILFRVTLAVSSSGNYALGGEIIFNYLGKY